MFALWNEVLSNVVDEIFLGPIAEPLRGLFLTFSSTLPPKIDSSVSSIWLRLGGDESEKGIPESDSVFNTKPLC